MFSAKFHSYTRLYVQDQRVQKIYTKAIQKSSLASPISVGVMWVCTSDRVGRTAMAMTSCEISSPLLGDMYKYVQIS